MQYQLTPPFSLSPFSPPRRPLGPSSTQVGRTTDLRVQLSLPNTDDASHFVSLQIMLEALCKVNEYHCKRALRSGYAYPPLYYSGVVYQEEKPGEEDWPDIPKILAKGFGDCEDLVAYRVGEQRAWGVACEPVLKWRWYSQDEMMALGQTWAPAGGVWMVHCLVRYPDGTVEDPSKLLGMGGSYTGYA